MKVIAGPLVSVVIPTYNHAHFLGRALQSVLDQTYENWEAIVIDNHSTDNTDAVMQRFADPRITYLKIHNKGVIAASRNLGIRTAKGEWVAFLDSDDWWTSNKLQVCFEAINGSVDFVYHDLEIVRGQPVFFKRKKIRSRQIKEPALIDLILAGNLIANSSVVVRKRLLDQVGGIDESVEMIAAEDYNIWLRIAKITNSFIFLPRSLGFYFLHNQGISQKDMSVPGRRAVAEFLHLLNQQQKAKLESSFRYKKGRFNYLAGNYADAKEDLLFAFYRGSFFSKAKALVMLTFILLVHHL